jgi:hypothetical protein
MTTSAQPSGTGTASMQPSRNSTLSMPDSAAAARALSSIASVMSTPTTFPDGPTIRAATRESMPPPDPISTILVHSFSIRDLVGDALRVSERLMKEASTAARAWARNGRPENATTSRRLADIGAAETESVSG